MIRRFAAVLILLSQLVLLAVVLEPTGSSAIWFSFVGHPLLGLGVLLAGYSIVKRSQQDSAD